MTCWPLPAVLELTGAETFSCLFLLVVVVLVGGGRGAVLGFGTRQRVGSG